MVGGGNRRVDGSFIGSNINGFAALDNIRRKKESGKEKVSSKGTSKSKLKQVSDKKPQVFWAPAPLTVKSWADVEDEEDDDYYATTAPPQAIWGGSAKESETSESVEESESEDELLDEDDGDNDQEEVQDQPDPLMQKPVEAPSVPKETERQLSKKERRKKELAELDAILANFGVNTKEKAEEESSDVNKQMKEGELSGAEAEGPPPSESKTSKKKKKKDNVPKDEKEPQDLPKCPEVPDRQEQQETAEAVQLVEDASAVDVKERLKKVLSKKKNSSKEMDAATRTASMEAAARSARLAAAKKKEKTHFNQHSQRDKR